MKLAVPQDWLDKAFTAVQTIQTDVLPVAHEVATVAEIVDPADAPLIASLDAGISALFHILVRLRDGVDADVSDVTLRTETIEAWRASLAALKK